MAPLYATRKERLMRLTDVQHEEIARLIFSSLDTRAQNRRPELTYEGCIVVKRSVTRLARIAGVRRLKSHSQTFRRAIAEFERKALAERFNPDEGRLILERLWRWLHGYVRPQPETPLNEPASHRRAESPLRDGDNFQVEHGLMMIEMPCNVPAENLREGDMVMIRKGERVLDGNFALVRIRGELTMGHIFRIDPDHIRMGRSPGTIYRNTEIEIIGPIGKGNGTFIPLAKAEPEHQVLASIEDWPDIIDDDGDSQ